MVDGVEVVTFEPASVLYRHTKKEAANETVVLSTKKPKIIRSIFSLENCLVSSKFWTLLGVVFIVNLLSVVMTIKLDSHCAMYNRSFEYSRT